MGAQRTTPESATMKRPGLFLPILAFGLSLAIADEGMWRPGQLVGMKTNLGFEPRHLSDLNGHPMNAVISLGGCTASFVSPDGLVITNHHCAYSSIQHNSTPDRNLLQDGFLARRFADELPAAPGSRVMVTVEVTDVTAQMQKDLPAGSQGRKRYQALDDRKKELVAACEKDPGHRCRVAPYSGGLEYELIKQMEIRDVRLVHAPAGSIGRYGGDVDNWMWPRHTGDYSFYRAYVGKDGRPADPSPSNVPYHPKTWLRIARDGVREGSTVLVAGYPGNTNRHRLASEVESTFGWLYPTTTRINRQSLDIIARETASRPEAAILYASTVASLNNRMKNNEGMLAGFPQSNMVARKQKQEADLRAWVESNPGRKTRFGPALDELDALVAKQRARREQDFFYEGQARSAALLGAARTLLRLSIEKEKPDEDREPGYQERDVQRIRERLTRMERTFDAKVDRALWRKGIQEYAAIPAAQHVAPLDAWFGIEGNRVDEARLDERLDAMYAQTKLADTKTRLGLMEATRASLESSQDPFMQLAVALWPADKDLEEKSKDLEGSLEPARARYMEARIAFLKSQGLPLYPDANGTLRVTYGTVKGYRPRDGVVYTPFTMLEGILGKDKGTDPFDAPATQLAAIRERKFNGWEDPALGSVPVNFLSTLDITGGNSGSPTLDAQGDLVGLAFDGNWESIISGWDFQPEVTRCISVDIRYVLWVMQTMHDARELLHELGVDGQTRAARTN
jgi:hypothetical protein